MGNTFVDISGQTFNELTAIECLDKKTRMWKWKCSCGKECTARKNDVTSGRKKSCGHLSNKGNNTEIKPGDKFNEWTAEEYLGEQKWKCRCSCGKESIIHSYDLRKGNSKSCGHSNKGGGSGNRIKMEGQRIGEWTVGEYLGNGEYECTCSCGTVKKLKGTYLRTGQSKSCGHATNAFQDLTGQTFGDWTVLEFIGDYTWKCRCSCGEIRNVGAYDLKTGKSTNCGHLRKEDLKGKRFGRLIVKEYLGDCKWICKCDCGNETVVLAHNLKTGSTKSCGCLTEHKEEELKAKITEAFIKYLANYSKKPFTEEIAKILGITNTTVRKYVNKYDLKIFVNDKFGSLGEKEVYDFIKTIYSSEVKTRDRTVLNGLELDIYIPDKNIAIEYNGNFWHSELKKSPEYHQQKSIECLNKGIRLIHIFEHEWNDQIKRVKIENILRNILSDEVEIVYGRQCDVRYISSEVAKEYCEKYHLQGYATSSINIGLYRAEELLGVLTLGSPRFNSDYEYEIIRLVWKNNIRVVGGFDKMLKFFIEKYKPNNILTYVDFSKFNGNSYEKVGFTRLNEVTTPGYVWFNGDIALSRYQTQKHKLIEQGLGTIEQSESDIMYSIGYNKIHDCGNIKLVWRKN